MSGWYYLKEGMFDDSEVGPITDATFLQSAFDGVLKPKSKVRHESHTRNQWAFLEQIPAAQKKIEEGIATRAQKAGDEKLAKELRKQEQAAKVEEQRKKREAERALTTAASPRPRVSVSRPVPAELVGGGVGTPGQSPFFPSNTGAGPHVTAVQVNVDQSRTAHSLGIASLVLAILSFFVCWMPYIGIGFAGLGLLLGGSGLFVALFRKGAGIGYSIAGAAVSSVALVLGLIFTMAASSAFSALDKLAKETKSTRAPSEIAQPVLTQPPNVDASKPFESVDNSADTDPSKEQRATTAVPTVTPTPSPVKTEVEWPIANQPLKLGDVQIEITDIAIGKVPLWREILETDSSSVEDLLTVRLKITNVSERKKIDYRGWMSTFASLLDIKAELSDDAGNRYRAIQFGGTMKVKDANTNTSIYPGKSITDAVVFELPITGVQYLRLKLSGKGCDEKGEIRFQIPSNMINKQ